MVLWCARDALLQPLAQFARLPLENNGRVASLTQQQVVTSSALVWEAAVCFESCPLRPEAMKPILPRPLSMYFDPSLLSTRAPQAWVLSSEAVDSVATANDRRAGGAPLTLCFPPSHQGTPIDLPYLEGFPPSEQLPTAEWIRKIVTVVLRTLLGAVRYTCSTVVDDEAQTYDCCFSTRYSQGFRMSLVAARR